VCTGSDLSKPNTFQRGGREERSLLSDAPYNLTDLWKEDQIIQDRGEAGWKQGAQESLIRKMDPICVGSFDRYWCRYQAFEERKDRIRF